MNKNWVQFHFIGIGFSYWWCTMEEKEIQSKPITVSRPKDTSLAAYKEWVTALCERFTRQKICIKLSEEQWTADWKAYWDEQSAEELKHALGG